MNKRSFKRNLPKTREELFKILELPNDEESNKALSELIAKGLVERSKDGYCLTNPYGIREGRRLSEMNKNKNDEK